MTEPLADIFSAIYKENVWGRQIGDQAPFSSGSGSRDPAVVSPYVTGVSGFLRYLAFIEGRKPDVVDLGCGDFFVGSQLRGHCGRYTACDVVGPLIEFNRSSYRDLDVDFQVVDIATDAIPKGDVGIIRQVLQHLSNEAIAAAMPSLQANFRFLIITEHLPPGPFVPNLNKPSDAHNRLYLQSGVMLTSPPFNLVVGDELCLASLPEVGGLIHTLAYRVA